jgi:CDP-glycerol glycerophosphotransferase (TagB/SpsB family)
MYAMRTPAQSSAYSFASANRAKLAAVPRYAWGAVRSLGVKRDPMLWVIGSDFGLSDGGWAFYQAALRLDPAPRLVWQVNGERQRAQAIAAGVAWVDRESEAGFELALRAGVIAVTHGLGDVNRFAQRGALIVQLWHGSPLKKLNLDSPSVLNLGAAGRIPGLSALMRTMYKTGTKSISVFPVACPEFVTSMCSAFALNSGQVLAIGEPRGDQLFTGTPTELRAASRALWQQTIPDLGERRLIVQAPTWRDGEVDPTIPTPQDWERLEAFCQRTDSVLVIRPHPKSVGDYHYSSERVQVIDASRQPEIMPLLWGVDVLVTDYSSILFDYAVTGAPILYLAPDLEHYEATRGLYIAYTDICGPDGLLRTWDQVVDRMETWNDPDAFAAETAQTQATFDRFITHRDGRNSERTVARVLELLAR